MFVMRSATSLELPLDTDQATKFLDEHDLHDVLNKLPDEAFDLLTGRCHSVLSKYTARSEYPYGEVHNPNIFVHFIIHYLVTQFCFIIMCLFKFALKGHSQNDSYCVGWDVKPYSLTHFSCKTAASSSYCTVRFVCGISKWAFFLCLSF